MLDLAELPAFVLGCVVLVVTPGANVFLLLRTTIASGIPAGAWALLGMATSSAVQALLIVGGLGLWIVDHPMALVVVRWLGAAYLLYLAGGLLYNLWRSRGAGQHELTETGPEPASGAQRSSYWQGLLCNSTNPKRWLFCLALMPQFLGHASAPVLQLLLLGGVFVLVTTLVQSLPLLAGAGRLAGYLRQPRPMRVLDGASAVTFLGLSVGLLAV